MPIQPYPPEKVLEIKNTILDGLSENKRLTDISIDLNCTRGNLTYWMKRLKIKNPYRKYLYRKPYVGEKFGRWIFLEELDKRQGFVYWKCQCDCDAGNTMEIRGITLITKKDNRIVLGCTECSPQKIKRSKIIYGEITNEYWRRIQRHAKEDVNKIKEFCLTPEYIWQIYLDQNKRCSLSGLYLTFASRQGDFVEKQTASLDRKDSSLGYIEDNVQWIHKKFQPMKWDQTDKEFIKRCYEVTNYQDNLKGSNESHSCILSE